ncbi:MFS transporter [Rhizohabitans arisaemae]|uniref:MFS transporter n=1 Tax=Rhizohabitans arisaemae TaxID=2720610 RepID=UPI0024B16375|nr:MFS transporter [Rhizohabitans arisaemae]
MRAYRELFEVPGAKGFVLAGFIGRMPMSMLGLGVVLLISAITGSYATAGAVAAIVSLSFAVSAPLSGRLADRFGQRRVLVPMILLHGAGLSAMMLCAKVGAPVWTLFLTGVVTGGAAVSLTSMVRARWAHVLQGSPRLHTAFSFESVVDEVVFVGGPALITGLATLVDPYAGLILTLVLTLGGTLAFAFMRRTEPPVRTEGRAKGSPITIPGVALLSVVFLAMGSVFGSVDLITVAFAEEEGAKGLAGLLLGAFAAGSMVSGLWYGARRWQVPLQTRYIRALGLFAVGLTPILFIDELWLMGAYLFVAGFAISPTIISGYALIERLVPSHMLTEGMAWVSTAVGFGVAIGAWAGGRLTDMYGAQNAYAFAFLCGVLAIVVGLGGSVLLRERPALGDSAHD